MLIEIPIFDIIETLKDDVIIFVDNQYVFDEPGDTCLSGKINEGVLALSTPKGDKLSFKGIDDHLLEKMTKSNSFLIAAVDRNEEEPKKLWLCSIAGDNR